MALLFCQTAAALAETGNLPERFQATKPGVELTYRISYHVLGLSLMRIGEARALSVEGEWLDETGERVPAFLADVHFDTDDDPAGDSRGRISIHNRMVAVMSSPELHTLLYFKEADEYLNPFFKSPRHECYLDFYQVKDGRIDYFRENHATGERSVALENAGGLLQQGNAIATMLQRMASVYTGKEGMLSRESDFRVFFNVEGAVKPFAAETSMERVRVDPYDMRMDALRIDVSLAPEAPGSAGELSLWGVPFGDFAGRSEDAMLIALANSSPEWSMIPLRMNYSRPIGYIRCSLVGIEARVSAP